MKNLFLSLLAVFTLTTSFYVPSERKTAPLPVLKSKIIPLKSAAKSINASEAIYSEINFNGGNQLNYSVFETALKGFDNLKKAGKISATSHLLSICDFSLSSNKKRLWVIDLDSKTVIFNTLVAHGKNTGEEFAENFSNQENSLQSSLGFYRTEGTYIGDNGFSLKLEGLDNGFNDAAMRRAVVMHGADYVSEVFAAQHQRIGRSWGCPAVPRALAEPIINTLKGENCLFIYYPDQNYLHSSKWLNG